MKNAAQRRNLCHKDSFKTSPELASTERRVTLLNIMMSCSATTHAVFAYMYTHVGRVTLVSRLKLKCHLMFYSSLCIIPALHRHKMYGHEKCYLTGALQSLMSQLEVQLLFIRRQLILTNSSQSVGKGYKAEMQTEAWQTCNQPCRNVVICWLWHDHSVWFEKQLKTKQFFRKMLCNVKPTMPGTYLCQPENRAHGDRLRLWIFVCLLVV